MTEQEFQLAARQWRPLLARRAAKWSARLGQDVDDLIQEALAWRYRHSYRPEKSGYGTFFCNCLRSACSRLHTNLQSKERFRLLQTCSFFKGVGERQDR